METLKREVRDTIIDALDKAGFSYGTENHSGGSGAAPKKARCLPPPREKEQPKMKITEETLRHLPTAERQRVERQLHLTPPPNEHHVFVYGTLLSGEGNAHWATGARRHPAWTHGTIYDTGFGFPAYVREGETKIVGELLAVDDEGFRSMDRLEGHPHLYRREEIVVYPLCGGRVRAWVYIMNSLPKDAKVIASGNWRTRSRG